MGDGRLISYDPATMRSVGLSIVQKAANASAENDTAYNNVRGFIYNHIPVFLQDSLLTILNNHHNHYQKSYHWQVEAGMWLMEAADAIEGLDNEDAQSFRRGTLRVM